MTIVFLNGEYLPVEQARISVLDRGFTFADSVYEVIPVYGDQLFRVEEHLQRLHNSLGAIGITNPHSSADWQAIFSEVLNRNAAKSDRSLYIQVSRGVSDRDHLQVDDLTPTVFVMSRNANETDFSAGVHAITHKDIRWDYCHIKATTLLANVILKQRAKEAGAFEAILVKNGFVTEGAATNVFVVSGGTVMTPAKDGSVLPGVTRDLVVELLEHAAIPCLEGPVALASLETADEVWLTSSSIGVAAVTVIDGNKVGNGKPGTLWQKTNALFREFKNNPAMLR